MADNPGNTGKQDDTRINVNKKQELDYWRETLNIPETKIRDAVKAVGPLVKDVKRYLQI
jgi:hypothetical protein